MVVLLRRVLIFGRHTLEYLEMIDIMSQEKSLAFSPQMGKIQ